MACNETFHMAEIFSTLMYDVYGGDVVSVKRALLQFARAMGVRTAGKVPLKMVANEGLRAMARVELPCFHNGCELFATNGVRCDDCGQVFCDQHSGDQDVEVFHQRHRCRKCRDDLERELGVAAASHTHALGSCNMCEAPLALEVGAPTSCVGSHTLCEWCTKVYVDVPGYCLCCEAAEVPDADAMPQIPFAAVYKELMPHGDRRGRAEFIRSMHKELPHRDGCSREEVSCCALRVLTMLELECGDPGCHSDAGYYCSTCKRVRCEDHGHRGRVNSYMCDACTAVPAASAKTKRSALPEPAAAGRDPKRARPN